MIFNISNPIDVDTLKKGLEGKKIGLTSGSFDFCHPMHLMYLKRCRRYCDVLVVGIDSDDLVKERKGPDRPIFGEFSRMLSVDSLDCVSLTFILGSVEDFSRAIDALGVHVVLKNEQFNAEEIIGRDRCEIRIIPDIAQYSSTTEIVEALSKLPKDEVTSNQILSAKPSEPKHSTTDQPAKERYHVKCVDNRWLVVDSITDRPTTYDYSKQSSAQNRADALNAGTESP